MKPPIEPIYILFGARVRQMREILGMTQADLAKRVGLTRTSVVNIEAGRQRVLLAEVDKFALAFGTTPKNMMRAIWL